MLEVAIDRRDAVTVVPGQHPLDGLAETVARSPAKCGDRLCRIQHDNRDVVRSRVELIDRLLKGDTEVIGDNIENFFDGVTSSSGHVEDSRRRVLCNCEVNNRKKIVHIDKITDGARTEAFLATFQSLV